MEVDRVSRMSGVGRDGVPAWPKTPVRRRKFAEEVEEPQNLPEDEKGEEAVEAEPDASDQPSAGELDVMA